VICICLLLGSMLMLGFESIDGAKRWIDGRTERPTSLVTGAKFVGIRQCQIAFVITYREATFAFGIVTHYSGLTPSCVDYHNHCACHFQSLI